VLVRGRAMSSRVGRRSGSAPGRPSGSSGTGTGEARW